MSEKCPECGTLVSDKTTKCPKCGKVLVSDDERAADSQNKSNNGSAFNAPAYFEEILRTEFSMYSIRKNVPVTELAGNAEDWFRLYETRPEQAYKAEWGQPYNYVLYQSGKPVAVVMLGEGHSHDSNVKYLIARMYAKKMNLPYINFYTQFPNTRDYVINRINRFLNSGSGFGKKIWWIIGIIGIIGALIWIFS